MTFAPPAISPTSYVSALNQSVPLAHPGEFKELNIGPLRVWPPVVLAPMAGVTDYPFRAICRRYGAGLYVTHASYTGNCDSQMYFNE